jgi:DNA-binding transcriptional LysR family regulator
MVAITCLPEIIQIIEQTHPLLKIEVTVASSLELSRLVFERKLDVALISNPQVIEGVQLREIAHAEVAWLGIPDPVLSRANLRPADLAHRKVLTVPAPNVLSSYIGDWCAEQNVPMLSVSTCNSVAIIARLVAAGVAISVLPTCVLADELDAGEVVRYGERTTFAPIRIGMAFQKNIRSDSADGVAAAIGHAMSAKKLFQMV